MTPLPKRDLGEIGLWVARLVLDFGGEPETAFQVAAVFVAGVRRYREGKRP